jgi:hypothetical protein
MIIHGPDRSDRELMLPQSFEGPPLEPEPPRPGWLQRLLGIRWEDDHLPQYQEYLAKRKKQR